MVRTVSSTVARVIRQTPSVVTDEQGNHVSGGQTIATAVKLRDPATGFSESQSGGQ
jgi:hypothetical protein